MKKSIQSLKVFSFMAKKKHLYMNGFIYLPLILSLLITIIFHQHSGLFYQWEPWYKVIKGNRFVYFTSIHIILIIFNNILFLCGILFTRLKTIICRFLIFLIFDIILQLSILQPSLLDNNVEYRTLYLECNSASAKVMIIN